LIANCRAATAAGRIDECAVVLTGLFVQHYGALFAEGDPWSILANPDAFIAQILAPADLACAVVQVFKYGTCTDTPDYDAVPEYIRGYLKISTAINTTRRAQVVQFLRAMLTLEQAAETASQRPSDLDAIAHLI